MVLCSCQIILTLNVLLMSHCVISLPLKKYIYLSQNARFLDLNHCIFCLDDMDLSG